MTRYTIMVKLLEVEGMLQDVRLDNKDRHVLHGAQQALRGILEPEVWHPAPHTFYRIDDRARQAAWLPGRCHFIDRAHDGRR